VEIRNQGDQLAYQTEKTLNEFKEKLPGDVVSDIESKLKNLKETLKKGETEPIKKATDDLIQASQKMGELLYKESAEAAAAAGGAPGAQANSTPPPAGDEGSTTSTDGDVIDAEFKESKD